MDQIRFAQHTPSFAQTNAKDAWFRRLETRPLARFQPVLERKTIMMDPNVPGSFLSAATEPKTKPAMPLPVVYACSGCSDAGELADRIARKLTSEGVAQMSCLAGIGGRVKSLVAKAEKAERILAVDGCPLNCARKTLELAGFHNFEHLGLNEIGLRKGSCPVTEANISAGVEAAKHVLRAATAVEEPAESMCREKQEPAIRLEPCPLNMPSPTAADW